jgi:hypothetical protein
MDDGNLVLDNRLDEVLYNGFYAIAKLHTVPLVALIESVVSVGVIVHTLLSVEVTPFFV